MPWVKSEPQRYQAPLLTPASNDCSDLHQLRKMAQQAFENLKRYKRYDPEFFKEESNYWRKVYRGACYAIGYLSAKPSGDCVNQEANQEIAPFIDSAFNQVIFGAK